MRLLSFFTTKTRQALKLQVQDMECLIRRYERGEQVFPFAQRESARLLAIHAKSLFAPVSMKHPGEPDYSRLESETELKKVLRELEEAVGSVEDFTPLHERADVYEKEIEKLRENRADLVEAFQRTANEREDLRERLVTALKERDDANSKLEVQELLNAQGLKR